MAAAQKYSFPLLIILLIVLLMISASSVSMAQITTGTAGFTSPPYSEQACTEKASGPTMTMFTGVNEHLYGNGDVCGQKYLIACIGGVDDDQPSPCTTTEPIEVMVTDVCSPEADNEPCPTFVLSKEAFACIARPRAGVARVSYERAS